MKTKVIISFSMTKNDGQSFPHNIPLLIIYIPFMFKYPINKHILHLLEYK